MNPIVRKLTILILTQVLLAGCASMATKLNRVSIGMTKAEVIHAMGTPKCIAMKYRNEIP